MKKISHYLLPLSLFICVFLWFADTPWFNNLRNDGWSGWSYYYGVSILWWLLRWDSAQNILFNVFFLLAGFLFVVALMVAFFAAIRLFISNNSEEDVSKWSKTLIWSIAWLFLVSISYSFVRSISNAFVSWWTNVISMDMLYSIVVDIVYPILNFLRYIVSICFFAVIVYAFYRIIFSGWDEEKFQQGKTTFIIATFGFIIMLLAEPIVKMAYGWADCLITSWWSLPSRCMNHTFNTSIFFNTVIKIIVFLNGFIALVTMIMIIYAGILVLTGGWDEEKSEKAKKIIMYVIIGVLMILFSYVLYRVLLFNVA